MLGYRRAAIIQVIEDSEAQGSILRQPQAPLDETVYPKVVPSKVKRLAEAIEPEQFPIILVIRRFGRRKELPGRAGDNAGKRMPPVSQ